MSRLPDPAPDDRDPAVVARLRAALEALEAVAADRSQLAHLDAAERVRLMRAAGDVYHPDSAARRRLVKETARRRRARVIAADERALEDTGIRRLRREPVFDPTRLLPPTPVDCATTVEVDDAPVRAHQNCYVCKRDYHEIHHFYDQLCPECAEFNFSKRSELADLRGRVALLTGGRVKIGYQTGLKLLRCGARLIVTTRFPRDAAMRYAREPDFAEWSDRLEIYGLDLRHTPSVEVFCRVLLDSHDRLDYVVNNACQTVRRPPEFYEHMLAAETGALRDAPPEVCRLVGRYEGLRGYRMLPEAAVTAAAPAAALVDAAGLARAAELSQVRLLAEEDGRERHLFPQGALDQDLQQVDLRARNSWRLELAEVPAVELLEVHLVNAVAPFLLNARLKALMLRSGLRDLHVVNVSAVEGQFYRRIKTTKHPHTNMAKAALNMMTRTAAADYVRDGIHMNAVDTGWVTDEDPAAIAERKRLEHRFHPPLDIIDGAARIVDPIIDGANTGPQVWGQFLKDYRPTDW